MNLRLDDQLEALKAQAAAAPEDLEFAVWQRVEEVRESRSVSAVLLTVRAAAVVAALGIGVAGGGLTAAAIAQDAGEISAFSIHSTLAPSTLLDRRG